MFKIFNVGGGVDDSGNRKKTFAKQNGGRRVEIGLNPLNNTPVWLSAIYLTSVDAHQVH